MPRDAQPPDDLDALSDGLREQKKRRTRQALFEAAVRLFTEQGFEATTVEDIATAAEVSTRTFNRYFGTKEAVILVHLDQEYERLWEELRQRPVDEPPLTALRAAVRQLMERESELGPGYDEEFRAVHELLVKTPTLLARSFQRQAECGQFLAEFLAARMGVDANVDVRPRMAVAQIQAAAHAATEVWWRGDELTLSAFGALFCEALEMLDGRLLRPS